MAKCKIIEIPRHISTAIVLLLITEGCKSPKCKKLLLEKLKLARTDDESTDKVLLCFHGNEHALLKEVGNIARQMSGSFARLANSINL